MRSLIFFLVLLSGCQSVQERNMSLVNDRLDNMDYLAHWRPTACAIETELTAPARARYTQLFPNESSALDAKAWIYSWRSERDACEVKPDQDSPMRANHKAFLNEALCVLLQVYWVNSPFSDLEIKADEVMRAGDKVQIRISPKNPHLGVYLDEKNFLIETITKSQGTLRATYALTDGSWAPIKLEQILPKSRIVVDDINYDSRRINGRKMIKSFWVSAGEEAPVHHTQVKVSECRGY